MNSTTAVTMQSVVLQYIMLGELVWPLCPQLVNADCWVMWSRQDGPAMGAGSCSLIAMKPCPMSPMDWPVFAYMFISVIDVVGIQGWCGRQARHMGCGQAARLRTVACIASDFAAFGSHMHVPVAVSNGKTMVDVCYKKRRASRPHHKRAKCSTRTRTS